MTCTKRAVLAAVLAATIATSARADTLTRTIQYHANAQPTIYCAAALLCEIRLANGEKITRAWNPQAQIWSPDGGEVIAACAEQRLKASRAAAAAHEPCTDVTMRQDPALCIQVAKRH